MSQKYHMATSTPFSKVGSGSYLQKYMSTTDEPLQPQFKPLVQVDPSVLGTNRMPLQNPRKGDYLLNKTASTEGIASKKSLELKKRYLLGEQASGNKMQKSGSTSVLDSKIRSFHSNISECQKLLNPSSDKSSATKIFFDHSKLCKNTFSDTSNVTRSGNILNDLRAEITIQKASATASTDNEKENQFVNSKNELNKGMEYSETVNTTLVESLSKKSLVTPSSNQTIIETIDLVTPEKQTPIIDLTQIEIPPKMLESNVEFIKNIDAVESKHGTSAESCSQLLNTDSNKIIDLTCDSPAKSEKTVFEALAPDISKDVKERIPDIIEHIEGCDDGKSVGNSKNISPPSGDEHHRLLSNSYNEEKKDSPEKSGEHDFESHDLQIQVPNIPWNIRKPDNSSSNCSSSCSSNTSSIEDIQHFILESTTSPETQTAGGLGTHQVPRLEVHDTAGELMQIDSLMIVDSRYVGDPEDLKLDIPEGLIIAELPAIRTSEVEDEPDVEPDTATPEPMERTVIEAEKTPPVPDPKPAKVKPADLKFDTRNENKVETLKHLPLIVEQTAARSSKVVKPSTLNLMNTQKPAKTHPPPDSSALLSPQIDNDKTPTAELLSRGSDSETEATGTAPVLTETELSDWTADDCISENFVDIEFVLNSNRNTIKRSKKSGRKMVTKEQSMSKESSTDCPKLAPVADFEGILRNLDIDEIEFMDTGSEGSCAETYSATNTALLQNRGFVEFIESTPKNTLYHKPNEKTQKLQELDKVDQYHTNVTKLDEVLGVDYIEQGAYIMRNSDGQQDLLKTPVNEHSLASSNEYKPSRSQLPSAPSQTMTDSSTLNDIDDDSVGLVTNSGVNTKTTTDESEALTVVTSPLDDSSSLRISVAKGIFSTPSSSDKNPKTSTLSACSPTSVSTVLSSNAASIRLSGAEEKPSVVKSEQGSVQRYNADEISCEDYVRALQQKITQISNARDSLDMRKQRRRSSKGETPLANFSSDTQTVIESARIAASESNGSQSWEGPARLEAGAVLHEETTNLACTSTSLVQPHKLPEILTLTSRLEEITKERTKQKDLIHDLVMNKLQSKKQLNAEKRLHRSRQRCLLTSCANGSSLSPTPKLAAATTTTDTNCTSQAHYHVSTSAVASPKERLPVKESSSSSSFKENQPLQKSSTYVAAYSSDAAMSPVRMATYKQRPFSEHLDVEQLDALERYKLTKTPSFSYAMSSSRRELNNQQLSKEDKKPVFPKPLAPFRANHMHTPVGVGGTLSVPVSPTHKVGDDLSPDVTVASTDKLRTEARARARLKSNSELGLSPEEKMQLLRKRLNLGNVTPTERPNCVKSADRNIHARSARDHKMSSSKSVSDLVTIMGQHFGCKIVADENFNTTQSADFVSDPNLLQSSSTSAAVKISKDEKSNRRQKDPERRKSLIQSLSNFFHMGTGGGSGNGYKDSVTSPTGGNSAQTERPGISGSGTTSSSIDGGVFSRFRIASRSKEKSKSCFDIRSFEFAEKDAGLAVVETNKSATTTAASTTRAQYERSNSQDCLINTRPASNRKSKSNSISNCFSNSISNTKHIIHNRNSHHSNNNKHLESSATAKHSTSSPQLFVSSSRALATSDEQIPPPIPPLPLNYQRSDDESYATESREQKKQRSISKAMRQAELKRLRIAQEIQREQEEIEVQLKELEARGVLIEKALRGEGQHVDSSLEASAMVGATDEKLLKELLEIWRNITQLKKRDEELGIRQQELQLEHRHAQLKEELNIRLSSSKLDKSSADVAAEGAILNEMLEIVAKRASLRPTVTSPSAAGKESISKHTDMESGAVAVRTTAVIGSASSRTDSVDSVKLHANLGQSLEDNESHI